MSSITDILAPAEAEQKYRQLQLLARTVVRARQEVEEKGGEKNAQLLQLALLQYKEFKATMPLRVVQ